MWCLKMYRWVGDWFGGGGGSRGRGEEIGLCFVLFLERIEIFKSNYDDFMERSPERSVSHVSCRFVMIVFFLLVFF